MAIDSKSILKSGAFITRFNGTSNSIPSGAPVGDMIVLTPPVGMRVQLSTLRTSGYAIQEGISVLVAGAPVLDNVALADTCGNTTYWYALGGVDGGTGSVESQCILAGIDEDVVIKNTGTQPTRDTIYYCYQFGE